MPKVLVRDLDAATVEGLKARAERHGRSLQGEMKAILEEAAAQGAIDPRALADRVQALFAGRHFSDSADLIREDRER